MTAHGSSETPAPQSPKKVRPPVFFDIPAATPAKACNGRTCGAAIYWVPMPSGKRMPVDVSSIPAESRAPTADQHGRGVPHWGYCPDRDAFTKRK